MKPHFSDLTTGQQANFGDGCSWVPDFQFTANCRQHDFNYYRACSLKDKLKADWDGGGGTAFIPKVAMIN